MQRISDRGLDLIKKHEGLRLQSYLCTGKKWTIGYGHTRTAKANMTITQEEAEALLREDIESAEGTINRMVHVPVTSAMFDALVSLRFNIGARRFINSTLCRKLNEGHYELAAAEFPKWIYSGGKVTEGLIKRRQIEQALFLSEGVNP